MNPKAKKVLAEQGSQVVQAFKWIGGAIFGDGDEVLDDMAARGDPKPPPRQLPKPTPARKYEATRPVARRVPPAPPPRDVIDVEGFTLDDEEDE